MLQKELQSLPQLTYRGDFQSPPTQALGATAGNGNGATAGNDNGTIAGNGNGSGATGGNGNGRYQMPVTVKVFKPVLNQKSCRRRKLKL
jgi:hypothetical protein